MLNEMVGVVEERDGRAWSADWLVEWSANRTALYTSAFLASPSESLMVEVISDGRAQANPRKHQGNLDQP